MPPRIRTRASKALKENIDLTSNKSKLVKKATKVPRKALADKTNSASDDASLEVPTKTKKTITKTSKTGQNKNGEQKQNVETKISRQKRAVNTKENVEPVKSKANTESAKSQKNEALTKSKQNGEPAKLQENSEPANDVRPRRERRLPTRLVQNTSLNNLSNGKDSPNVTLNSSKATPQSDTTPAKKESLFNSSKPEQSPFKTPAKADNSLLASRPRRICRLPSRFDDHSISPHKYIPIQPANASTPIQLSKSKPSNPVPWDDKENRIRDTGKDQEQRQPVEPQNDTDNVSKNVGKVQETRQLKARPTRLAKLNALQKEITDTSSDKSSPDTNNNAKGRINRKKTTKTQPPVASANKKPSPVNQAQSIRKFLTPISRFSSLANQSQSSIKKVSPKKSTKKSDKNLSFKLLGSKKTLQENENNEPKDDIYEFTFDPNEEPKPQKKKRKRTVTKKPTPAPVAKPKKVVYKSSYEQNISKALAALKNAVKPGTSTEAAKLPQIAEISDDEEENVGQNNVANDLNAGQTNNVTKENNTAFNDTGKNSVHGGNYPSIRVEDIAADIEPSIDHHDDINYSPVNSPMPHGFKTPNAHASENHRDAPERSVHNNDPLNLLEELSFFDEQPVASSSMNMSVRHPLASPWRVEFGSLPIKWPNNTYVKPNMTPAVETSFINPEDSSNKKKHVYTNLLQNDEMFTDAADNTPNLKQPSIISFIKEMAEKSAKKKRGRSVSPAKAIYQGVVDVNIAANNKSAKKVSDKADTVAPPSNNTSEELTSGNEVSTDKENSKEERRTRKHKNNENSKEDRPTRKRKNNENICDIPAKSPRKQKDKDCTFFGFDDSENQDENVSPVKINNNPIRGRLLRTRSKAVLQEINGPTRAVLPVAAKTKIVTSSEAVNKVYEGLKSGADAPVFPENNVEDNVTNIEELDVNDDSQSVHLFEDIEVVHHLKPTRKSYGKAKKVTFRQASSSDSDTQVPVVADQNDSSDYDDLGDLTFEVPNVQEKKVTKKKKTKKLRSKKEEKEAEAWAANFNSMCEDIEEFTLVVE
ncbi:hypothetical protein PYW08_007508 [Mythimna loreyi]|uniref:Uncharacterized protein n=1 Tax=Mythimna loreyi TaxID=667449 RepID=A0ACC2QEG1_9NEOP|nr:hypothetical protein PYW08_007508 [Mythimna loreyi]